MDISVALNGAKKRNLFFYEGDDSVLNVAVYANDGDSDPIQVDNLELDFGPGLLSRGSIDVSTGFTSNFCSRQSYRLLGSVNSARTTLAYGLITSPRPVECFSMFDDYGWCRPGYVQYDCCPEGNYLGIVNGLYLDGAGLIEIDGPGYAGVIEFS